MKNLLLFLLLSFFISLQTNAQYYEFPSPGWVQGVETNGFYPPNYPIRFNIQKWIGDTTINNQTYQVIDNSNWPGDYFIRQENGKVISYWNGADVLLFDFGAPVGDTLEVYSSLGQTQNVEIIERKKYLADNGDSLAFVLVSPTDWSTSATFPWLEGIGHERSGLFNPPLGFETDVLHACTYDLSGQLREGNPNFDPRTLSIEFLHGEDKDGDWVFNHYGNTKTFAAECDLTKKLKIRACDTLLAFNYCGEPLYFSDFFTDELIAPISGGGSDTIYISDFMGSTIINVHHNFDFNNSLFGRIEIYPCTNCDCDDDNALVHQFHPEIPYDGFDNDCNPLTTDDDLDEDGFPLAEDCNDNNPDQYPGNMETVYNGIDDDCNPLTLDDDLDEDGFPLAEDCNDNNPDQYPGNMETVYNGIDDDCNPLTLDDDLDEDGFPLAEDCDDTNADINPNGIEIPNNGIDEDCDGDDLMTSLHHVDDFTISVFPNPVYQFINIQTSSTSLIESYLYDVAGNRLMANGNSRQINLTSLPEGVYCLEIYLEERGIRIMESVVVIR